MPTGTMFKISYLCLIVKHTNAMNPFCPSLRLRLTSLCATATTSNITRALAGHSHYRNTRHRKAAVDTKRMTLFTKLAQEIYSSIAEGGTDVSSNLRLSRALANARRMNMPKSRLDRALNSATRLSNHNAGLDPVTYDAILPRGVAVRVRALQSRPRAIAAELRSFMRRAGGDFGKAAHFFHERFTVTIHQTRDEGHEGHEEHDHDHVRNDIILSAMECNVSDVVHCDDGVIEFICQNIKQRDGLVHELKRQFPRYQKFIIPVRSVEPAHLVQQIDEEYSQVLRRLLQALDDHSDVVEVLHNADI